MCNANAHINARLHIINFNTYTMVRFLLLFAFIPICLTSIGQDNEKLYKKYNSLIKKGKKEQAITVMQKIEGNNSKQLFNLLSKVEVFFNENKLDSAKIYLSKTVRFQANYSLPVTDDYIKKRNESYKRTIPIVKKIIENDSVSGNFCDLAVFEHAIGLTREAIIDFGYAIKFDSTEHIYYYDRAGLYREINELDSSVADYTMALKLNPKYPETYLNRGFTYLKMELYEKAIYDLERVQRYTNETSTIAYAFNNMGYAYYKLGKLELAEQKVNLSINNYPSNSYAYYHLALIKIEQKDSEKACQYIAKSLALGFTNEYGNEVQQLQEQYCKP